jgi:pimeloyl-ACP methyl ester carboxylesterase
MNVRLSAAERETIQREGIVEKPSDYSDEPYPFTYKLIADGRQHILLDGTIVAGCPVTILQGGRDKDVVPERARRLVSHILLDPVTLTLVPDGDHRLSRPEDLALLERTLEQAIGD